MEDSATVDIIGDSSVPAAEVLADLKDSVKRRRAAKHRQPSSSSRRLDFSHDTYDFQNSASESSEGEGEGEEDTYVPGVSCVTGQQGVPATGAKRLKRTIPSAVSLLLKTAHQDQAILHAVSSRLRNLLKLPKAHKWCYYEWFYSDIDQPLLERENDFCRCLSDMFPELKTRYLTRIQWRQLRRLMGKPRRCSPMFFAEERALLEYRRNKVRKLQQQVHQGVISDDFNHYKDLPDEIPALLVLGTRVTARLHSDRERESGFYTGKIEAVEFRTNKYWVTFDRPGVGKHLISDTEIKSAQAPEFISIASLESAQSSQWPPHQEQPSLTLPATPPRSLISSTTGAMHALLSPENQMDPFLTSSPGARRKMFHGSPTNPGTQEELPDEIGGFSVTFLRQVTQLSKLLQLKQHRILKLNQCNTEAEKMQARQKAITSEFQHKYAKIIIDLDDINKELNIRLDSIKSHCDALGCGTELGPTVDVHKYAEKITQSSNASLEGSGSEVKEPSVLNLIARLTGLLLQIEGLSESGNSVDLASLTTSLADIETHVHHENRNYFQSHVESPITLIQSGMSPIGPLRAFIGTSKYTHHH